MPFRADAPEGEGVCRNHRSSDRGRTVWGVVSLQSLSEDDRRLVARWAERVLPVFEAGAPGDDRARALIASARGELGTADGIRQRFRGGVGCGEVPDRHQEFTCGSWAVRSSTWARPALR